jgi:hypothetical protein
MGRVFRRRPSPAMVVALIALIVALSGSAYALSKLNGKRLVKRSVAAGKIKKNTLTGKEINEAKLGSVPNATSLARVDYEKATGTFTAANSTSGNTPLVVTASCPPGLSVIGGGATVSNEGNDFVNDSGPTPARNGWTANGFVVITPVGQTMTVTAICAAAASTTP